MRAVIERKGHISLNDHIAEYMRADKEFMDGIRKGVRACCEGKVRPWVDVKKELRLH